MTSPAGVIAVDCPACQAPYETSYRASVTLTLEDFSEEYLDEIQSGTCPACGHRADIGGLIVGQDGIWRVSWLLGVARVGTPVVAPEGSSFVSSGLDSQDAEKDARKGERLAP